jgi:hypothetical protein
MFDNLTLASAPWLELFLVLAAGGTIIVALAAAVSCSIRSAVWQQTLWQVATLGLLLLVAVELSGAGRGLSLLCSTKGTESAKRLQERLQDSVVTSNVGASSGVPHSSPGNHWQPGLLSPENVGGVRGNESGSYGVQFVEATSGEPAERAPAAALPESLPLPAPTANDRPSHAWPPLQQRVTPLETPPPTNAAQAGITQDQSFEQARIADGPVAPESPAKPTAIPWWLAAVWAAGAVILLTRMVGSRLFLLLFQWRRTSRCDADQSDALVALVRQIGLRRGVRIVRSEKLSVPVAFGWLRPTVALPAGFFEEFDVREQRAMLVHELAHLAAGDPVWQAVSDLLCALMWWHPMVWWSRFRLQSASEAAADEASLLVPDGPDVLAGCLVAMGRRLSGTRRLGWVSIRGPGFRSALGRRVQRLLQLGPRKWRPPGTGRAASARLVLPVLLVLAAVFSTAWARPQATSPEGGTTMSVWQSSVGRSVAATVLCALMGPAVNEAPAEQPAPGEAAVADVSGGLDLAGLILAQRDDESEPREGDRSRRDREEEQRERDRPRGDRERGEWKRREGDPPREGDRPRDGDRPREGDRDRERPHGEWEDAARRNEENLDRERHRAADYEEHLHRMMRERDDLAERAHHVEREMQELGEKAPERRGELRAELDRIAREVREIEENLHRGRARLEEVNLQHRIEDMKRRIHSLSEEGRHEEAERMKQEGRRMWAEFEQRRRRGDRPGPPHPELERRMHHLRVAIENLRAAGMHDAAQRLVELSEQFMREHAPGVPHPPHRPDPHSPHHEPPGHMDRPPMPGHAMNEVEQLRHEVRQMREEMRELREALKRQAEREGRGR